jgi:hypothetical protein
MLCLVGVTLSLLLFMPTAGAEGLPDVAITSSDGLISGIYQLNVTVTGDLEPGEVYYAIDDDDPSTVMTDLGGGAFGAEIDTTTLTDGPHKIYVKAVNSTGADVIVFIEVDIDTASPSVVMTTPGGKASGDYLIEGIIEDAYLNESAIYLVVDDDLEASRGNVMTRVDDHFEIVIDTTAYAEGGHMVRIWAYDLWGSYNKSGGEGMFVDNTAPTIDILSEGGVHSGIYLLRAELTDVHLDGLNVTVAIGDDEPMGMDEGTGERTFQVDTTRYDNGDLVLVIVAPDLLGNTATDSITITVDNRPDLSISDVEWSLAKAKKGETVEANVTVQNDGDVNASGFKVAILENGSVLASFDVAEPLAAGESAIYTIVWTVDGSGERILSVQVDPDDSVGEYDETDNAWSETHPFEVTKEEEKEKEEDDSPGPGAVLAISGLLAVTLVLVRGRRRP